MKFNKNNKILKFGIISLIILLVLAFSIPLFAYWGKTEKGGIYWVENDGSIGIDGWKLIDDDGDGTGQYYYFNENGFILLDDITPDYMIVNKEGKRIDNNGDVVNVKIEDIKLSEAENTGEFSAEIMNQIKAEQDNTTTGQQGLVSSGTYLFGLDQDITDGPKPSDNIVIEKNADGTATTILGPNVKLTNKSGSANDKTINRKMQEWISGGSNYVKSGNGTTFTKSKWKACMALKGHGSNIIFDNPSNNFNLLKGRIATHHFTYSERTTQCTLHIYNADNGEELLNTSEFNYNAGCDFSCAFPKKTKKIKFELEVTGQYTSRVCYLRDCTYGFDRDAYEDELYEDENERIYRQNYGYATDSEIQYEEEDEVNPMGEQSTEGEDPGSRYRRLTGNTDDDYWLNFDYSEDDDSITDAMKASISEARARYNAQMEQRNKVSGPAYDENLKNETEAIGPLGGSRFVPATDVKDAS